MPLTCHGTLNSIPLGPTNVKEYPRVNLISVNAYILAGNACTTAHELFSLDHIVRFNDPKRRTTALEAASEPYWLVKALAARVRYSCCSPAAVTWIGMKCSKLMYDIFQPSGAQERLPRVVTALLMWLFSKK